MNNIKNPQLSKKGRASLMARSPVKEIMTFADANFLAKIGLKDKEIISFAGGWVNHDAPVEMREAYENIILDQKQFHNSGSYSDSLGSFEAKNAISLFEKYLYGANIGVEEIAVGLGSTQLAINLFEVILDPGDRVLLLDPSYCNYPVQLMKAVPGVEIIRFPVVNVKDWEYVAEKKIQDFRDFIIQTKPKAVILISPDNPTSQVLSDEFCHAALDAVEKVNGYLVMDFAYRELIFADKKPSYFGWGASPNFISICSNSKWCRGLGRRLGWIKASHEIISALEPMLSSTILCPDNLHQMAFAKYIEIALQRSTLLSYIEKTRESYKLAAAHMVKCIDNNLNVKCFEPQGGLFTCINVNSNSASFVEKVLKRTGVLLVPGWGFGDTMKSGVRISYGPLVNNLPLIDRGIELISEEFK